MAEEEAIRGDDDVDLYAVLAIHREASQDEIKRAYKHWAHVCHPDRHQQASLREAAAHSFNRVHQAYEILSDEKRRAVYDLYGMQGIRAGLELGPQLKSQEEIRAEYERARAKQAERRMEAKLNHRGSYLFGFSVAGLLDWDAPADSVGLQSMALSNTTTAPMSDKDTAYIGAQAALKGMAGGGSLLVGAKHADQEGTSGELNASIGTASLSSISATLWRPLSQELTGSVTYSYSAKDGFGLALTFSRPLSESVVGFVQWHVAPAIGVSTGATCTGERFQTSAELKLGAVGTGVAIQGVRHVGQKSSVRASGKCGTSGIDAEMGYIRRVGELTSLGASLQAGMTGLYMKLRLHRGGQKFAAPILLAPTVRWRMLAFLAIVPPLLGYCADRFAIEPLLRRRNRRKELESRRKVSEQVRSAKQEAERTQEMLRTQAEKKRKREEEAGGLVIVKAVLGVIHNRRFPDEYHVGAEHGEQEPPNTEEGEEGLPEPYIDITVPLQVLVDSHELSLQEGTHLSQIVGSCDAAPGQEKTLLIRYRHQGKLHECSVGGEGPLELPQARHRI